MDDRATRLPFEVTVGMGDSEGWFTLPHGPGLGVELNEQVAELRALAPLG